MTSFFWVFEITATFLEQFFLLFLGGLFFEKRLDAKKHLAGILLVSLLYTIFVTYLNGLALYSFTTLAIGIVLWVAALFVFNRCNVITACCLSVIYMVIISAFDFAFIAFFECVLKAHDFVIATLTEKGYERLITLVVSKGLLVLAVLAIKIKGWKVKVSTLTAGALIVIAVFAFASMQYLVQEFLMSEYEKTQEVIFITFVFMMLFFLAVLLVLNGQEKMRRRAKEKEHMELELSIAREKNEELIETYRKIAKVSHDFKNQMKVTLLMLKKGDISEAESYLSGIVDVASAGTKRYTGISSVDTVLSEKERTAEERGIRVETDVSLTSLCGVDAIDICTVLLNLLDNAIEGCAALNDGMEKSIRVVLQNVNSMILIKIENTFDGSAVDTNPSDGMHTTKQDKNVHGFGLKIVRSIADKYNSSFAVKTENGRFVVTVLLCK